MGIHVIKMPDIGEGIAEVELVAWRVQPGDAVAEDQTLADVMTDKATIEIPSPVKGKVISLGGKAGDVMAVGADLIRLDVEGAGNVVAGAPPAVHEAAAAKAPLSAAKPPPPTELVPPGTSRSPSTPPPPPAPPASARPPAASAAVARAPGEKPVASPAVRRRAWELGVELQFVPGSGAAGRILHEDLDAYLARRGAPGAASTRYVERHDEEQVQVIGLRRKIAQKMQEAKRRIPHFTYVEEFDVTDLEGLRAQLNERHGTARGHLTLLPLLARAIVLALRDFPQINARFDDEAGLVTRYGAVHLGIATQTEGGLMVAVLRHAEARDPWSTAAEILRLAAAARGGKATRDELTGSTITITSLGPLGGIVTTPVINYPEVAIVGVGRIVERPVIRAGQIVARKLMNLSSSFDHRVVDGADGARFVQAVRGLLEAPALLFVD
jgi:2-oxoisovalerate dehydrogenase E2 component (dihydrolipoyl transacylase)